MLCRIASALAVAALAGQAAAEPLRKPYQPQTLALMSVRKLLPGLDRRQQSTDGYTPEPEFCSSGNSCAAACGKGYLECASDDGYTHCFNQAANQKCCPGGTGNSCDDGYFCASDTNGAAWCCPDDMTLKECAASYNLPGGELVVPTHTAEPTQATTSTADKTTTAATTSESSTTHQTRSTKTTAANHEPTTKETEKATAKPTDTTFKDDQPSATTATTMTTASSATTTTSIWQDVTTDVGTATTPAPTEPPSETDPASTPTASSPPDNGAAAIPGPDDPRVMGSLAAALVVALCGQLV